MVDQALKGEPSNPYLNCLKAQALQKLGGGRWKECLSVIEEGQKSLNLPKDEALVPQFARTGIEVANHVLEVGTLNEKKQALQLKIRYLRDLISFLER